MNQVYASMLRINVVDQCCGSMFWINCTDSGVDSGVDSGMDYGMDSGFWDGL